MNNLIFKKYDVKTLNDKGAEYMNDLIHQLEPDFSVFTGDQVVVTEDSMHPFCIPVVVLINKNDNADIDIDIDIDDFTYALNESHFC